LHVVPHCALGQVGEGAEFIKTESFGHEPILTLKLFKSSVNNLIEVRATLISNQKGKRLMGADDLWYSTMRKPPLASSPFD
jgi:hypothetical protein